MYAILAKVFTSSKNPQAISLTVKGFLVTLAPILMTVFGLTSDEYSGLTDAIESVIFYGATFAGSAMTVYGLIRKIRLWRWSHPDAG